MYNAMRNTTLSQKKKFINLLYYQDVKEELEENQEENEENTEDTVKEVNDTLDSLEEVEKEDEEEKVRSKKIDLLKGDKQDLLMGKILNILIIYLSMLIT